jgi:hypothetical protein
MMLAVGTAVGAVFATVLFSITVVNLLLQYCNTRRAQNPRVTRLTSTDY